MKPTKLIIKNIGKIASEEIPIDKPLIIFYGEIQQGKSTILNCVRWVFGGSFPDDIIRHGQQEGSIELQLDNGFISRSFYRPATGGVNARPVVFIRDGKPVKSPVSEIKRLLNPFLLDQDFLRNKTELERKQYFTELFAVDTSALDNELAVSEQKASQLRITIAGYGDLDLTKVEPVNVSEIENKIAAINEEFQKKGDEIIAELRKATSDHACACRDIESKNEANRAHNAKVDRMTEDKLSLQNNILELETRLTALRARFAGYDIPERLPMLDKPEAPNRDLYDSKLKQIAPDTSALQKQLIDAGAVNVRAESYRKNLEKDKARQEDQKRLAEMEKRHREIKTEKQKKLKSISDDCGIKGLEFDDSGNFIYQGTTAGMISDSQIMKLSSELSALYPPGFGLDLIDRAESLGKSIFGFVDRATAEKKTILATIVGERPATVPENIGVFVVEEGKLI